MKIEKKVIALSIVALAIGMATILPLAYIPYKASATIPTPLSDIDSILYALTTPTTQDGNIGEQLYIIANIKTTTEISKLKGADAQIEVYNFHVYSDKASIANMTYCVTIYTHQIPDQNSKGGYAPAITGEGGGFWIFQDGTKFDVNEVIGYADGNGQSGFSVGGKVKWSAEHGYYYDENPEPFPYMEQDHYKGSLWTVLSAAKDEKYAQTINNIENAQTLYIDVTRIMFVTYNLKSRKIISMRGAQLQEQYKDLFASQSSHQNMLLLPATETS
ncbi:MAG: hypothetical protein FWD52_09430, partial [Candidatus Bathyarchaeota archaeon]|nr:hypothetical protein [Candidatus Termiticorpusculum sp.]